MNSEPKYQPQQELENLQQKYNALQQLYQKKVDEQNISVRQITDVIESNPIPIQIVDKDGYTLLINDAFKALFGANPPKDYSVFNDIQVERLGYSNLFDDLKAGHAIKFPDIAYNAHNTNSNFHNTTIWVRTQAFPLADAQGIPDRFIFIHQDISEVKENEQALRESEEKYRLLLELAPDAFFHGNENGNFILVILVMR